MVKGYIYTIESVIAISMVLIAIVVIMSSQRTATPLSAAIVKQQGIQGLEFLDSQGQLRPLVLAGDLHEIKARLKPLLPAVINFDAAICASQCDAPQIPEASEVAIIDYYIAGYRDAFINRKIRVWMWGDFA